MPRELEEYYNDILSGPFDEYTFRETLLKMYEFKNAGALITKNFSTIFNNPNIDVLNFIFDDNFSDLFEDAVKNNLAVVLRMIVKKGNPVLLYRLEIYHRGLLLPKVMLVLTDNPKFDSFLERLGDIFLDELYEDCSEDIFYAMVKLNPRSDYEENKCRLKNLINLLSYMSRKEIENDIDTIEEMLQNAIRIVLENNMTYNTLDVIQMIEGITSISKKSARLKRLFESNLDIYISFLTPFNIAKLKEQKLFTCLKVLLKDILKEQNVSITDIIAKSGHATLAFIIGDRVLKIQECKIETIPYDSCLLRPLIRRNIKDLKGNFMFGLDICDRVETVNLDDEQIYQLFKSALSRGILLGDCHFNNVGILLRNNTPYLDGAYRIDEHGNHVDYDVDDKDILVENRDSAHTVLPAKSYVLLDYGEFVYRLKDFSIDDRIESFRGRLDMPEILREIKNDLFSRKMEIPSDKYLERYIEEKISESSKKLSYTPTKTQKM